MSGSAGRTGGGRVRRAVATALAAGVALSLAACQPLEGEFTITNDTAEPLLLWDQRIAPGGSAEFDFVDAGDCWPRLELVTQDLLLRARLAEPMCDGDRATVRDEDLVPVLDAATVRNASDSDVLVTFAGGPITTEQRLAPGERARLVLLAARAGCSDARLSARAAVAEDEEEAATVHHAGPICRGDEWVLDDRTLAAGAATLTVANGTDVAFSVVAWAPWSVRVEELRLEPGARVELDLGMPRDTCSEEVDVSATTASAELDGRAYGPFPVCDGDTWMITWDQVRARDPHTGAVGPVRWATISVTNATDADIVVSVDGGDGVRVAPGHNGSVEIDAPADGCQGVRLTADVSGGVRPQVATGLVQVCDGAQAVVTVEGIEITSPDGPPWGP